MYQQDSLIIDSDKQFRIPITGYLRSIGVSQIIGTKEYIDINFVGGESSIVVPYPNNINELHEQIRKKLLLETDLGPVEIDNIRFHVNEYIDEIGEIIKTMYND